MASPISSRYNPTVQYEPKKYFIQTYGCQANEADSSTIAGVLEALGFEMASGVKDSDVFLVNTCSVRQKSEDKVYGLGKQFARARENNEKMPYAIMAGCMVGSVTGDRQRYAFEQLKEKTPWVNTYINPTQILEIPQILADANILNEWALSKFDPAKVETVEKEEKHALVNISFGCDNFCSFCVVPYARGKEISKTKEEILKEIKHLADRGFTSVTLCGQNVNSWGLGMDEKFEIRAGSDQKIPFADLLREVHKIEGIEKIDFISSNPFDFTTDLIDALTLPKVSNHLHMAVQSGNNDVLDRMNRRHTIEEFKDLISQILEKNPKMEFGTDIIVGFPGETREQFEDTINLFKEIKFNVAFISIYSPRKGTKAEKFFEDDVPLKEKKRRHAELMRVWRKTKNA